MEAKTYLQLGECSLVLGLTSCHRRKVVLLTIRGPLSETPISKATPSELLNYIAGTPPLANRPVTQLPRTRKMYLGELSSGSFNVALSLMFETKNCGIEEDSEA